MSASEINRSFQPNPATQPVQQPAPTPREEAPAPQTAERDQAVPSPEVQASAPEREPSATTRDRTAESSVPQRNHNRAHEDGFGDRVDVVA
ncbi:MAG: hypothetical protein ACYTGH_03860 [Planctomycetota bacterium]|jgi:hypothetical protein